MLRLHLCVPQNVSQAVAPVWCGLAWFGLDWSILVWYVLVWCGVVWHGLCSIAEFEKVTSYSKGDLIY